MGLEILASMVLKILAAMGSEILAANGFETLVAMGFESLAAMGFESLAATLVWGGFGMRTAVFVGVGFETLVWKPESAASWQIWMKERER